MIVAFAGWPDAAEAATRAVRYLVRKLSAKKFAEIDPEEFYDFADVRPQTRFNQRRERVISWPANDFFYYAPEEPAQRLILYIGTEPNLRWRTFSNIVTGVAQERGVELVVSLGALLDAVPHTRETKVTGRASPPELAQKVEWLGIRSSSYEGPTGIHTAFMDACDKVGLAYASIWGHSPHYVNNATNPTVSHALLTRLRSLVDVDVDMDEMRMEAEGSEAEVSKSIAQEPEVTEYVRRLEESYDSDNASSGDIPVPEVMVKELEEFLKRQRPGPDIGEESSGPSQNVS